MPHIYDPRNPLSESHVYANFRVINNTTEFKNAYLSETRTAPLLDRPCDYHLTVARMNLSCNTVPIFRYLDDEYYVTLSYASDDYTTEVPFVQADMTSSSSRWIYSYDQFLDGINSAFASSMSSLTGAHTGVTGPAPIISYDETLGLFSISGPPSGVTIYFNYSLQHFFPTFRYLFYGLNLVSYKDYKVVSSSSGTTRQFASSNSCWNDIIGIVLKSTSLSAVSENINTSPNINSTSSNNSTIQTITDFSFPVQNGVLESSPSGINQLQYSPALYRLVELIGQDPISTIDLSIHWSDRHGSLYPLVLSPRDFFDIKLLFIKKTVQVQSS